MRTAFLPIVFAASASYAVISDAQAQCTKQSIGNRVRADVIFELQTGQTIYTNLSAADMANKPLDPASLTKLESTKEIIRRMWSGTWTKDTTFAVSIRPNEPPHARTPDELGRMSMVTSFNVMDQVARKDPTFMENVREAVKNLGMTGTNYLSPTGDPAASPDIRQNHRTTVHDLMISIRDYHLNYAHPKKIEPVFGRPSLSGLPSIADIPHIHRSTNTLTLLENAISPKAQPVHGVTDGKTAYSCNAGWGSYLKYDFNGRSFIVMTLGHDTNVKRDLHARSLIETYKSDMTAFEPAEKKTAALQPVAAPK
jgi:D-alanyl-D-alanine carboxypeptidase